MQYSQTTYKCLKYAKKTVLRRTYQNYLATHFNIIFKYGGHPVIQEMHNSFVMLYIIAVLDSLLNSSVTLLTTSLIYLRPLWRYLLFCEVCKV